MLDCVKGMTFSEAADYLEGVNVDVDEYKALLKAFLDTRATLSYVQLHDFNRETPHGSHCLGLIQTIRGGLLQIYRYNYTHRKKGVDDQMNKSLC